MTRRLFLPAWSGFWGRIGLGGSVELHLAPRSARSPRGRMGLDLLLRLWGRSPNRREARSFIPLLLLLFRRQSLLCLLCWWRLPPTPWSCKWGWPTAAPWLGRICRRLGRTSAVCLCVRVGMLATGFPGTCFFRLCSFSPLAIVAASRCDHVLPSTGETGAAVVALDGDFSN